MTLGQFLDMFRSHETIQAQFDLICEMFGVMTSQQEHIERLQKTNLVTARQTHEVALAWLLSLESPEVDMRDAVVKLERDLTLSIAKLEEHIVD